VQFERVPDHAEALARRVLTVRREGQLAVRHVMPSLTDEQLVSEVTRTERRWSGCRELPEIWRSSSTQRPGRHPVCFVVLIGVALGMFAFSAPRSRAGRAV
jgi:hypothetical protein